MTRCPLRRRLELHARAASALATRSGDAATLSERARHACLAVPLGDARLAVDLSREAAHEAEHAYAYDEAAVHYRRGLEAARSLDPPDRRATLDLTVRLAAAIHRLGDPQGLPMLLEAAQRARQEGDDAALVRAAMSFSQFGGNLVGGSSAIELTSVIEDALAVLGDQPSAARARLLIELGMTIGAVRVDEQLELARRPKRWLATSTIPRRLLLSCSVRGTSSLTRAASRSTSGSAVELEQLGHRLPSLAVRLAGSSNKATALLQRGEIDALAAGDRPLRGDRR